MIPIFEPSFHLLTSSSHIGLCSNEFTGYVSGDMARSDHPLYSVCWFIWRCFGLAKVSLKEILTKGNTFGSLYLPGEEIQLKDHLQICYCIFISTGIIWYCDYMILWLIGYGDCFANSRFKWAFFSNVALNDYCDCLIGHCDYLSSSFGMKLSYFYNIETIFSHFVSQNTSKYLH